MKTKEFIEKVEELGYGCSGYRSDMKNLWIRDGYNNSLVWIDTKQTYVMSTGYYCFEQLNDEAKKELLNLTLEYIKTSVEERKEPKKYYLRLPNYLYESSSYLNYNTRNKTYCFFGGNEFGESQTKFAQEEIDNLPNQEFIKTLIKEEV